MSALQIGIDLGTTNSLIAQFIDGKTRLIPNRLGHFLTPSAVSMAEDGTMLVGLAARERLSTAPGFTATAFKRFMGTNKLFRLGNQQFRAEELSALILKSLKEDAEAYLQQEVRDIVLTVPAYFNAIQRQATQQAAEMAGLNVLRLLNEPTAAGLAYNLQEKPDNTRFLVYALGGGTFDVSILDYFDGIVQVSASAGDNHLGGEDFLQALKHCFLQRCPELSKADIEKLNSQKDIWQPLEVAKRQLSQESAVEIAINFEEKEYKAKITREDFQKASSLLLARLRQPLERALRDARLKPEQIDGIILVGGATRMPIIRHSIAQLFKKIPQSGVNPDEAIAHGAAIQAALISRNEHLDEVILTDVMPFSLGTNTSIEIGEGRLSTGHFAPIIERNMPVPISRSRSFTTVVDNQTEIKFPILQGESPLAKENLLLGEMTVKIPPKPAEGVNVDVRFSYDINGLLEVDIINEEFNIAENQVFKQNALTLTEEDIQRSIEKLSALKIHPRDQEKNIYLVEKAKRLYEEYLGDNRHIISQYLAHFEMVLDSQDQAKILREQKKFETLLSQFDGGWVL